jgi:hypothetical protein
LTIERPRNGGATENRDIRRCHMFKAITLATAVTIVEAFLCIVVMFMVLTRHNNQVGIGLMRALTIEHPAFWAVALAVFTCTYYATR